MKSQNSSDTMLAFGGSEVDGDLSDHLLSSQANLTVLTKEIGGIDIGPDNDNEITNSSDTMLAFGGSEVDGDLSDHLLSSQANLTVLTKEIGGIDIGPDNDNEITNSSDTMLAFGGPEVDGDLSDHLLSSQANLTVLTREINNLQQLVESREGQPLEGLECIEWELQKLSLMLRAQLTSAPVPTEPLGEVICHYMDTLCTTQKQTNLTNSLLQDIAIFSAHDSTKLEEWLMDLETAANLTNESQAKLAKAKCRGLTCTLIMEAINSDKKHGMKARNCLD